MFYFFLGIVLCSLCLSSLGGGLWWMAPNPTPAPTLRVPLSTQPQKTVPATPAKSAPVATKRVIDLTGRWTGIMNGIEIAKISVVQSGSTVKISIDDSNEAISPGTIKNNIVSSPNGPDGTISANGKKITFRNNYYWSKDT